MLCSYTTLLLYHSLYPLPCIPFHPTDEWTCTSSELRCPNSLQMASSLASNTSMHPKGACLPLSRHCDGYSDCFNHTDERDCIPDEGACNADEFQCPEGWCIPKGWTCDRVNDCEAGEDELDCGKGSNNTCENNAN